MRLFQFVPSKSTKVHFEVDRLVFIHENFFPLQSDTYGETQFHEISFFYLMKSSEEIEVKCESCTSDCIEERLEWLPISNLQDTFLFPGFFKSELACMPATIKHFVTVEEK